MDWLEASDSELYDLRDFINCSADYDLDTKQQLMDIVAIELRDRRLRELMVPLVKECMEEQRGNL